MNRTRAVCCVFVSGAGLFAQVGGLTVSNPAWKGLEIRFASKIEPPGTLLPGGVIAGPDGVNHIIDDAEHKRVFGYHIWLDPAPNGQATQIRIERWNPDPPKITFDAGWTSWNFRNIRSFPT